MDNTNNSTEEVKAVEENSTQDTAAQNDVVQDQDSAAEQSVFDLFMETETFKSFDVVATEKHKALAEKYTAIVDPIWQEASTSSGAINIIFSAEYKGIIKRADVLPQDLEIFEKLVIKQGREADGEVQVGLGGTNLVHCENASGRMKLAAAALSPEVERGELLGIVLSAV